MIQEIWAHCALEIFIHELLGTHAFQHQAVFVKYVVYDVLTMDCQHIAAVNYISHFSLYHLLSQDYQLQLLKSTYFAKSKLTLEKALF